MHFSIHIENIWTFLHPEEKCYNELIQKISTSMSYTIQEYVRWRKTFVEFEYSLFDKINLKYPTGLFSNLIKVLEENDCTYDIIDKRKESQDSVPLPLYEKVLRDYQEEAVEKAINAQRGIIKIATGGGKTLVGTAIMARLNIPTVFVVNSLDLLEQTYDVFCETLKIPIGKIGGGECQIEKFNVCTIQTLFSAFELKYEPLEKDGFIKEKTTISERNDEIKKLISKDIGMIICDECQHLQSDMYIKLMTLAKNAYNRFGMSATPLRYESTDIILYAYAGKMIVDITASYLIDRKFLVPPTIYMLDPNEHTKYKFLSQSFPAVYNKWIVENEDRNNLIVDCCKRLLDLNRTILITVSRIKHGEIILEELEKQIPGVKVDFIRGEVDKRTRKELLEKVRSKELKILVGTSVADEGLDLPALDAAILAGGGISLIKSLQRIGRTLRPYPGKTNAIIVDFYDRLRYLVGQSRKRQKIYSQEPRFEIQKHF